MTCTNGWLSSAWFQRGAACLGAALRLGQHMHINEKVGSPWAGGNIHSSLYKDLPTYSRDYTSSLDVDAFTTSIRVERN